MGDIDDNSDTEWEYLSNVLQSSNGDEDLVEVEETQTPVKKPKTHLEAQIQSLVSPDAELSKIKDLRPGKVHIHGHFSQVSSRYLRRGLHITECIFTDDTGSVRVIWFNVPYKAQTIRSGVEYELRGNYSLYRSRFQISNSKIRQLSAGCRPFARGEKG